MGRKTSGAPRTGKRGKEAIKASYALYEKTGKGRRKKKEIKKETRHEHDYVELSEGNLYCRERGSYA